MFGRSTGQFLEKAKKTAKEAEDMVEGIAKEVSWEVKQVYADVSKAGAEAKNTAKGLEGKAEGIAKDTYLLALGLVLAACQEETVEGTCQGYL